MVPCPLVRRRRLVALPFNDGDADDEDLVGFADRKWPATDREELRQQLCEIIDITGGDPASAKVIWREARDSYLADRKQTSVKRRGRKPPVVAVKQKQAPKRQTRPDLRVGRVRVDLRKSYKQRTLQSGASHIAGSGASGSSPQSGV